MDTILLWYRAASQNKEFTWEVSLHNLDRLANCAGVDRGCWCAWGPESYGILSVILYWNGEAEDEFFLVPCEERYCMISWSIYVRIFSIMRSARAERSLFMLKCSDRMINGLHRVILNCESSVMVLTASFSFFATCASSRNVTPLSRCFFFQMLNRKKGKRFSSTHEERYFRICKRKHARLGSIERSARAEHSLCKPPAEKIWLSHKRIQSKNLESRGLWLLKWPRPLSDDISRSLD